jgi:epsilon-lactone hydrolase
MVSSTLRRTVKPALQGDISLESLRTVAARFDRWIAPRLHRTQTSPVELGTFSAEWIGRAAPARADPSIDGPIILYLPGGGFVARVPGVSRALTARICRRAGANALLTFYRLAPENPFPAGLDDCVTAYEYLLEEGVSPSKIVIGGDSAGGCLTLATMMALRDRGLPSPAAGFMLSPVTDLRFHHDGSRTSNADFDCLLTSHGSERWHGYLVGDRPEFLSDPRVSPLLGDFGGLPPMLLQASTSEILLDDSQLAAKQAIAAGVDCTLELFDGVPHVWHMLPWLPEAVRALDSLAAFVFHHTRS